MRRLVTSAVLSLSIPAVILLPVAQTPGSGARPVAPDVQLLPLSDLHAPTGDAPPGATAVSDELATRTFRTVGVSWNAASIPAAPGLTVQLRVREATGWSSWEELEVTDSGPDRGTDDAADQRAATEPLITPGATGVQVAITAPQMLPSGLQLVLIDPKSSPADSRLGVTGSSVAQAAVERPTIITRKDWGADESIREKACPSGPSYVSTIKAGFVHHTDTPNEYGPSDTAAMIRSIYAYHVYGNGWCDVGYNFLVDKYGQIFEGRFGGVDRPVLGAHTAGFNTDAFGVSMIGTYDVVQPSAALLTSLERLIAWKLAMYNVDPLGTTVLTAASGARYPVGTKVTLNTISGHRDGTATSCPGALGYAALPQIRQGVAAVDANRQFVNALYTDFLGRAADAGGLTYYAKMLDNKPAMRPDVVRYIGKSTEAFQRRVDSLYESMLQRPSDPTGRAYWTTQLQSGAILPAGMAANFLGSEETFAVAGKDLTAWTALAYQRALGRNPDPGGLEYWRKQAAKIGRYAVAANLYKSPENAERRVAAIYQQLLGRDPDPAGLAYGLQILAAHGDVALATITAASPEYYERAKGLSFYE